DYHHLLDPARLVERGLFVAEGRLVVRQLLNLPRWQLHSILLTAATAENLGAVLPLTNAPIYVVAQALMNDIAGFNLHRGCLALAHRPPSLGLPDLDRIATGPLSRVLVMEGVSNPDNIGGLFRTAAAFGVGLVVLGPSCGDPLYRKAIRTSMAATLVVPFVTAPQWPGAMADLKADGFTVAALTPRSDAVPLRDVARHPKLALMVGAEGDGLSDAALAAATLRVRIPMTTAIDSLNVTVAASIAMYHCWQE
ncbi:MAG: RNA methyltransferase, partial [Acidobacteria bacterium]|nr:RNA methyltransferase [Acidobacteriota bacterium]